MREVQSLTDRAVRQALCRKLGDLQFLRGELIYAWAAGDTSLRRLAAVRLVTIKAARVADVAAGFGIGTVTLWRWRKELGAGGVAALM